MWIRVWGFVEKMVHILCNGCDGWRRKMVLTVLQFFFYILEVLGEVPWPSHHPFLSSIVPRRSSKLHPVSLESWSASIDVFVCKSKLVDFANKFVLTSRAVRFLDSWWDVRQEPINLLFFFLVGASRICSKQHVSFWYSSRLSFSPFVSFDWFLCISTFVGYLMPKPSF